MGEALVALDMGPQGRLLGVGARVGAFLAEVHSALCPHILTQVCLSFAPRGILAPQLLASLRPTGPLHTRLHSDMADWKKTVDAELDALRAREVALKKARDAKRERERAREAAAGWSCGVPQAPRGPAGALPAAPGCDNVTRTRTKLLDA